MKPWIEPFRITQPSLCASAVISLTSKSTPGRQYAPSLQDEETVTRSEGFNFQHVLTKDTTLEVLMPMFVSEIVMTMVVVMTFAKTC